MTDGLIGLTLAVFIVFFVDWLAVGFSWRKVECVTKPLAMLLVVLWTLSAADWALSPLLAVLILAQVFGLAGDVFLLLRDRWFLLGLGSFLLGHLLYISLLGRSIWQAVTVIGFKTNWTYWVIVCLLIWGGVLVLFYRIIAPKSPRLSMPLMLWIPIQAYGWILSGLVVMSIMALVSTPGFSYRLLFLITGSVLFFISDSLLAYDRFKKKLPKVRVWIMITYHLAQFSLAVGFLALLGS